MKRSHKKPTFREYVVYRHGSNSYNQPMTEVMICGIWVGSTPAQALTDARLEADCARTRDAATLQAQAEAQNG